MLKSLLFLFLILTACSKHSVESDIEIIDTQSIAEEIQIPKNIMSDLDAELTKDSKTVKPVFLYMPIEVRFKEHSRDVLKSQNMLIRLPKGGGKIDLKNIVTGDGSYFMSFPPEQFEALSEFKPEVLHLYFVSNSPIKKIDDEEFGLGCGKMIDLKSSFLKLNKPDFLKLNTNEVRNLRVTAGRYIFILRQSTKLFMTQLTITDSRHSKELCMGADY